MGWEQESDLNRRPSVYETDELPLLYPATVSKNKKPALIAQGGLLEEMLQTVMHNERGHPVGRFLSQSLYFSCA